MRKKKLKPQRRRGTELSELTKALAAVVMVAGLALEAISRDIKDATHLDKKHRN